MAQMEKITGGRTTGEKEAVKNLVSMNFRLS